MTNKPLPSKSPKSKRGSREVYHFFTKPQVESILAVPNLKAPTGLRNRVMMELMYRCGLRVGEVCSVSITDIRTRDRQEVHLRSAITKMDVERYVPLEPELIGWIERWLSVRAAYAGSSDLLFVTLTGSPVSPHDVGKMMKRCGKRAGIDGPCHPHMLRHTYSTQLHDEGLPMRDIQYLLGHKSVQTTEIYVHASQPRISRHIQERER